MSYGEPGYSQGPSSGTGPPLDPSGLWPADQRGTPPPPPAALRRSALGRDVFSQRDQAVLRQIGECRPAGEVDCVNPHLAGAHPGISEAGTTRPWAVTTSWSHCSAPIALMAEPSCSAERHSHVRSSGGDSRSPMEMPSARASAEIYIGVGSPVTTQRARLEMASALAATCATTWLFVHPGNPEDRAHS